MLESLRRRGPDQSGEYFDGPVALVHARLSVVDLELGRQPMRLTQGREAYALVYNGELYNTEELRRELLALGHRFAGHSDTEVLLHAYAEWKEQCVHRLNGIFAFAVWEERARRLFIARDRIGVKPFFYALRKEGFVFGSEIKALLASSFVEPVIGRNSIAELLFLGPGRTPGCGVFRGVEELKPGFCGFVDESGPRLWRYWRLADAEHRGSFAQTAERVRELVIDAVKRQLVADVPLGTFLSGGLDSSLISAIAAAEFKKRGERLKTFSVDYVGNEQYFTASHFQPNSDRDFIGKMNDFLGAEAHIVTLNNEELARALYAAVEARDLPGMADVDASLLLFCEKIKEEVTVALSGECADEIFGGYPWYRDKNILKKEGFPWAQSTAYRAGFLREEITAELDGPAFVTERYRQSLADCSIMPDSPPEERRMKEMVNLNFDWFMQTLLDRKDRMSMFSGLEVRVPFCDYRIAETLYAVPWGMKNDQGREKGLLREAMRGLLPDEILWRKKSPYPKTHNPAYLRAVSAMLREVTANPDSPLLQIVKKEALEALLRAENPTPWYGQLMTTPQTIAYFVQMDYWMRKYKVCLA
jgi:asparagine synthase (glutamine-hydrolysing)